MTTDNGKRQGKIEIKIGKIAFTAEGDQEWLGEQLTKVLAAASTTTTLSEAVEASLPEESNAAPAKKNNSSLASYIKEKGGDSSQLQRFLAAAGWQFMSGQQDLTAGAVAKTLADHHQKKLANPADCLNKNTSKGYCEKKKQGGFFITPEGWKALGEEQ
jgi:hypothetical protein